VPGDLNGDFVVNSDDLALLELMLGDIPTLPGDGRNLDGHTTIDAGDVSALLLLCNSLARFWARPRRRWPGCLHKSHLRNPAVDSDGYRIRNDETYGRGDVPG